MKIIQITKTACLALATLLVNTSSLATPGNQEIVSTTNEIVAKYSANDWFAGSVIVKRDGVVLHQQSYGLADIPNKIANTVDTKIRIGSINKHYTAVLILQKVQAGELSLDDTLAKFDLGFADNIANQITVRQLLQHRSGFDDIFNDEYFATYRTLTDIDAKLPLLIDKPLLSSPGSEYKYSNYGYIVLGAILEKLEQKPFKQIIEHNIFKPLGVTDTHYTLTAEVEGKARSYRYYADRPKDDKTDILENVTPDGGMYSTPSDVAAFYSALFYTDKLLDDYHKTVLASYYKTPTKTWAEIANSPTAIWSSYGGAPGVSAAAEVVVKDKLIVVVLANTDGLVAEKISQEIVKAYKGNNT